MNEPAPSPPPPPVAADAPSGRRRLRLVALGVIAVILVGGLWLAFRSPADLVQGMADADSINVSAKVTARVSALLVAEGERELALQILLAASVKHSRLLGDFMRDVVNSRACRERGLFQRAYLDRLLAEPEARLTRLLGSKLWHSALLELWLQLNVDPVTRTGAA